MTDTFLVVVTAEDGGGLGNVGGAAMEEVHRDTKLCVCGGGGGLVCFFFVCLFVVVVVVLGCLFVCLFWWWWWWRWWFGLFCFLRVDVRLT